MANLLQKIFKTLAYVAAAIVIFMAIAVGLFRLMLPRLPEYQAEIKQWANSAIGMQVEFTDMNARWRLSGPELTFQDAALTVPGGAVNVLDAREVSVGVNVMRLLSDRELVADRISIRDTAINVTQSPDGRWMVQGIDLAELAGSRQAATGQATNVLVDVRNLELRLTLADQPDPVSLFVASLELDRNERRTRVRSQIELPDEFGGRVNVTAVQRIEQESQAIWQLSADSRGLQLARWSQFQPQYLPNVQAGTADIVLSARRVGDDWQSASADFAVNDVIGSQSASLAAFSAEGHIEYARESGGWVLAATGLTLNTVDEDWPESTLQLRPRLNDSGDLQALNVSASFVNLDDARYFRSWLTGKARTTIDELALSGQLSDVTFDVSALDTDRPLFNVAADFVDAGMAATDTLPGVRGITGRLRADSSGGRLEVDSTDVTVSLPSQLAEPIRIDDAAGTVIWRANDGGTTILSDSIRVRNAELDSQSSLQVMLPADGSAPLLDLESEWSINDISSAPRYLPQKLISPGLYRWLSTALVAGSIPRGRTRVTGPVDRFPFDGGEGTFRVDADLVNTTMRYSDKWPDAENMDMQVVLDGARLYSVKNTATSAGNSVVDANVEIADLRKPVLTIDAFATGSLQSIKEMVVRSPIASVFGERLADVSVSGDASFELQLELPILDRANYDFTARIQTGGGSLQFNGFRPAITELNGVVTVTRDAIVTESLFGMFLGEPVDIDLQRLDPESPFNIEAIIRGSVSDEGLSAAFATPFSNYFSGESPYMARLRFPKTGDEPGPPFEIAVDSDLQGIAVDLPVPLGKPADTGLPLALTIQFPAAGRIEAFGTLTDSIKWTMGFQNSSGRWDFDRGILATGGAYPDDAPTRGLHIVGQVEEVRLDEWLVVARRGSGGIGMADRIRSIDVSVDNLYVIGQHLRDHRVQVQRSALDWFVDIDGDENVGSVTVPYDFASGRPLIVDMERLTLPGSDEPSEAATSDVDPRTFPPTLVRAGAFSLGDRQFGSLTADFNQTDLGLESINLATQHESFSIGGSAGWVVDDSDPAGHRSYLQVAITSSNVVDTMRKLSYQPGIRSNDMEVNMVVGWSGGPRQDFLTTLSGEVNVRMGAGQLEDVEPGAGRVFGLMSVVALPRRLSLDFRDVFDRGFGFDEITGSFQVENGIAYTCDLSLKGPAADVGVVGKASLVDREYEQTVLVSGNVGNTLPVLGGVVAGPQVAAALLIFSQIFKKPLQEMGQVYYGIDGSWDDPQIEPADSERFAVSSELASCLDKKGG
ncbi:MAG: TIGR02099 family protein [Gammaproteobacteria bacterium]|nr:TIGR02099 family protein [Gammaproteobacteria bacterium]